MIYLVAIILLTATAPAPVPGDGPYPAIGTRGQYLYLKGEYPTLAACERVRQEMIAFAVTQDPGSLISKCGTARDVGEYGSYSKHGRAAQTAPTSPSKPDWDTTT